MNRTAIHSVACMLLLVVATSGFMAEPETTPVLEGLAVRESGIPKTKSFPFFAWEGGGVVRLFSGGEAGNAPPVASAWVWINGSLVAEPFQFSSHPTTIEAHFEAGTENELRIRLAGKPGGTLEYRLFVEGPQGPAGCLSGLSLAGPSMVSPWPFGSDFESLVFSPMNPFLGSPSLIAGREPSGLVYVPRFDTIFMVDDESVLLPVTPGLVADERRAIRTARDPEGVTYDPATNRIYLVDEKDNVVIEYSYEDRTLVPTWSWSLSSVVPVGSNGPTGLAFVPTEDSGEGGVFYVGSEHDGVLRIVELDLKANGDDGYEARLWATVDPPPVDGYDANDFEELSALHYEEASGYVYALWRDDVHLIGVYDSSTSTWIHAISLDTAGRTGKEEGFTFDDRCRVFLADDEFSGVSYGRIRRFSRSDPGPVAPARNRLTIESRIHPPFGDGTRSDEERITIPKPH